MDWKKPEEAVERDLKKDFVDENALKTRNFDKFWFHILWVMLVVVIAICAAVYFFYQHSHH